ncbi:kinase-like protein [Bimuria novae-zelandiae CBS 107.79]|uniref:Kinase-like protein n=1 Tax=Bimuria novae-zelandiae CBS 107.79 TaxID=1447943 RepID=A0A6A5UUD2_9PLEO|nr:kinase-like protein [Bimuria novae-zelandiae CBS 107.79]
MDVVDTRPRNPRTYTPPSTPTRRSHSKSSSVSSTSIREELDKLRRGMSPSGNTREEMEKPGSTDPREYPLWQSDYEIDMDDAGAQKVIGQGVWSTVYMASPLPSMESDISASRSSPKHTPSEMTPPLTPVRSRGSSMSSRSSAISKFYPPMSSSYAVKVPYEKTAHRVLTEEGRILSYLSRFPSAEKYLVPYFGQDMRTDALVMGYMPSTLDSLSKDLNTRDESDRAAMLTDIFPHIACNLLDGLAWLQDKACVHGDIKPANILIETNPLTRTPHAVYADFSAATMPSSSTDKKTRAPMGGATWDFMAPSQLTAAGASAPPTPESDVWALAMTLLVFVAGASPYERIAPNAILKREILKQGKPLDYVAAGENGVRSIVRLGGASRALGFNVKKWLGKALVRDEAARMGVAEWREELADALV